MMPSRFGLRRGKKESKLRAPAMVGQVMSYEQRAVPRSRASYASMPGKK